MKQSAMIRLAVLSILLLLIAAGCGGNDGDSEQPTPVAGAGQGPPAPPCESDDCFQPGPPEPGTDVPEATVKFGFFPAADNAFQMITTEMGWFEDVGISIEPSPYGVKETLTNQVPLTLRGTIDVTALCGCVLPPAAAEQDVVKQIMFTDDFVAFNIFADPDLGLQPVSYYLDQGMSLEDALRSALEPIASSGDNIATSETASASTFVHTAFALAGLEAPEFTILRSPQMLELGQAGRLKFLLPAEAPYVLELIDQGWTSVVSVADILDNAEGGIDSPVEALVLTVGVAANKNWVNENPNTALRFVSAVFRTIDEILEGGPDGELMQVYTPFLNSIGGTDLTPEEVYTVFTRLDPLTPWDEQEKYFEDTSSAYNYKHAYGAQTAALVERDALPEGEYPPDGYIWAGQIYSTLRWYQTETDKLFASLQGDRLSPDQEELLANARQYYEWHNYLDAYRLATAASEA